MVVIVRERLPLQVSLQGIGKELCRQAIASFKQVRQSRNKKGEVFQSC